MRGVHLSSRQGLRTSVQILLRLFLAAAVLLPLAVVYGEALVSSWLTVYRTVFAWVADDFKLLNLTIDHEGADRVLRAQIMWQHIVIIGGKVIYPDLRDTANASTLLAHALQAPLAAMLAALAWPSRARDVGSLGSPPRSQSARPWLEWAARGIALLPLLAILVLIDMPVVLAGELWDMVLDALDPGATSPLVIWKQFMQGGGRYALGLAAGVLAVLAARRASQFVGRMLDRRLAGSVLLSPPSKSSR